MSDEEQDKLIGRIAAELRKPVAVDPSFDARLMAAVRADARGVSPSRLRGAWGWLVRPRTFSVSPLAGLALAAGIVGLVVLSARVRRDSGGDALARAQSDRPSASVGPTDATHGKVMELFVYVGPRAESVALVGDFNDWDPAATPMRASSAGVWVVQLPLAPGRHEYAFLVDGRRWAVDPSAPPAPADDFGSPNSVITVADATS